MIQPCDTPVCGLATPCDTAWFNQHRTLPHEASNTMPNMKAMSKIPLIGEASYNILPSDTS